MSLANTETGEIIAACTPDEARAITEQIRETAGDLFRLLAEAHDRQAWKALGYDTFKAYVTGELNMSRSHAYRLLDQARVVAAIEESSGVPHVGHLPTRTTDELKPHLDLVRQNVEDATKDTPEDGKAEAARAAIDETLAHIRAEQDDEPTGEPEPKPEPPRKRDVGGGLHHPAPYSDALLDLFGQLLNRHAEPGAVVLDPFAGTGRIHFLRPAYETVGVELEPEWANLSPHTFVGDATDLTFADDEFDAIVTSPTYGNRLADSHNASDPERRRSYTHDLGRQLTDGNSGGMQWGEEYRVLHDAAWCEARRVLRPGGLFLLNIKDHIRNGERQQVCLWHLNTLRDLGFEWIEQHEVPTRGLMAGANHDVRAGGEMVYVLRLEDA